MERERYDIPTPSGQGLPFQMTDIRVTSWNGCQFAAKSIALAAAIGEGYLGLRRIPNELVP